MRLVRSRIALGVLALLCYAQPVHAAFAEIFNVSWTGGANGGTSGGVTSTNSTLIVINCGWFPGTTVDVTISDNQTNTYTSLTKHTNGNLSQRTFYKINPTTAGGGGHTFTSGGTSTFPSCTAIGFSSGGAVTFDKENGTNCGTCSSISVGSTQTPTSAPALFVSGAGMEVSSGPYTVSALGTSTQYTVVYSGGNNEGSGIGYEIQSSATARDPSWAWTGSTSAGLGNSIFLDAGGGGGGASPNYLSLLGVGAAVALMIGLGALKYYDIERERAMVHAKSKADMAVLLAQLAEAKEPVPIERLIRERYR
jgi:hypothetical protein